MIKPYYVGVSLKAGRPVPPAPVPANFKNQDVIDAKKLELAQEALAKSPTVPTAGVVRSAVIIDDCGDVVFDSTSSQPGHYEAARQFVSKVAELYPDLGLLGERPATMPTKTVFVGIGVHTAMRVACLEVLESNNALAFEGNVLRVPPALHRGQEMLFDPYTTLVHTDDRRHVSLARLLGVLGISAVAEDGDNPLIMAHLALELSRRGQLFATPDAYEVSDDDDDEADEA